MLSIGGEHQSIVTVATASFYAHERRRWNPAEMALVIEKVTHVPRPEKKATECEYLR